MLVTTVLAHWFDEVRIARERARTRRILGNLPLEIRKDIGWPDDSDQREESMFGRKRR